MSASMTPPPADPASPAPDMGGGAQGPNVVVTIVANGDGTFMVYPGDEPEGAEPGDASQDDVDAMGPGGDQPAGQSADSVGAALKIAMDILQAGASGGGGAEASFMAAGGPPGGAAPPAPLRTKAPMPMRHGMMA